jgi:hypothetical protein
MPDARKGAGLCDMREPSSRYLLRTTALNIPEKAPVFSLFRFNPRILRSACAPILAIK